MSEPIPPGLPRSVILLCLAAWLAGCGGTKVEVKTSTLSDFRDRRTYAWAAGEGDVLGVYGNREQLARRVMRESIDEWMRRNGFRPAEGADADLQVVYQLGVSSRREISGVKTVVRNGETFAVPAEVTIYRAGTLLIYLVDPRVHDVVWVGAASAEAKATDSDSKARSRLERGVRAVFDAMKDGKST